MRLKMILEKRSRRVSRTSFGGQHGQDAEKRARTDTVSQKFFRFNLQSIGYTPFGSMLPGHTIKRRGRCRWYRGIQILVAAVCGQRLNGGRGPGGADSGSTVLPSVSARAVSIIVPNRSQLMHLPRW